MSREAHVRFSESPGVKPPGATRRLLRKPVICRKNFYLSRAVWSCTLAACLWSLFATLEIYDLNPLAYLTAYLEACARNGGKAPSGEALGRFLPWNMSEEERALWTSPRRRAS